MCTCVSAATQPVAAVPEKPAAAAMPNARTLARALEKEKEEEEELTRDKFHKLLACERPFDLLIRDLHAQVPLTSVYLN